MEKRLADVLAGREGNYLLPFYWQHGDHHEKLSEQIRRIYDSGCRALCVESRTHEDFCGEGWWRDMDVILKECKSLGMRVFILDDKHFPTGYANGQIAARYPERRQWELTERHLDVMGPLAGASFLMRPSEPEEPLVGVYAFRRSGEDEELCGEPIDLSAGVSEGTLYWDIPTGCYRIFFLYKSRRGGRRDYMDMISAESVSVLIEAVYEPHYARYADYFGNTLAGFFSDEPCLGNGYVGETRVNRGIYERRIGQPGLALPYNETLLSLMSQELGEDASPYLGELWYWGNHSPRVRLAYMNAVTSLYRSCFCRQVGDWCRAHGVLYLGHIIEDMNSHARLGVSAGHYFRSLEGQDMSGIDIVLHQVMPGFAHFIHTASCSGGVADPAFNHYVLGQLAASMAHHYPHMKGRALCEVFGAYGWGEGAPMMKWLIDFLLVRGVNHFVPHAFSPSYPDPDCPPHFGAEGHDPQFDGFSALMRYTNKAAHLLTGGVHKATAAILYHAEGEWMSPYGASVLTEAPAKNLLDHQIAYDILPCDILLDSGRTEVENGRLIVGEESFSVLILPWAPYLPEALLARLSEWDAEGLPILWADPPASAVASASVLYENALGSAETDGVNGVSLGEERLLSGWPGRAMASEDLADFLFSQGFFDIRLETPAPLLRFYHIVRENCDIFFFFNESSDAAADTVLLLPARGDFVRLRLSEGEVCGDVTSDGRVPLRLLPGQSEFFVFRDRAGLPGRTVWTRKTALAPRFSLELADSDHPGEFQPYRTADSFFSVNDREHKPGFSGWMRYTFSLMLDTLPSAAKLDLGRVGETARLRVNGQDLGIRISPPYAFRLDGILRLGENDIEVEVANTLAGRVRDSFSYFLTLPPAGLLGPITLYTAEDAAGMDEKDKEGDKKQGRGRS